MSQIHPPLVHAGLAMADETAWEAADDEHVILQRLCSNCDHGLLLAPARFCPHCGGSGFVTRMLAVVPPRLVP